MNETAAWTARPISVRVRSGERRNPVAMVRLAVGRLELEPAVSRLKKGGVAVRSPMSGAGAPAVSATPGVWQAIEMTAVGAVAADPAAREHLLGEPPKRVGEPLGASGPAPS